MHDDATQHAIDALEQDYMATVHDKGGYPPHIRVVEGLVIAVDRSNDEYANGDVSIYRLADLLSAVERWKRDNADGDALVSDYLPESL